MGSSRVALASVALLAGLVLGTRPGHARCNPTVEPDRTDVANARAAVASNCDCAGAATHGAYVSCAAQHANAALVNKSCAMAVKRCASRSTCGKPDFETCCRTSSRGRTSCSIKATGKCLAPRNGHACTGTVSSCCDACTASGCAGTTTTTSTTLPCAGAQPFDACGSCGTGACLALCDTGCSTLACLGAPGSSGATCTSDGDCPAGERCGGLGCAQPPPGPFCGFSPTNPARCSLPCP